ncbi:MAG: hypothetical protein GXO49_04510 [Chlorobi bacterium]|nr:hypothetical protein [Chlorobiota bacterium]
MAKKSIFDEAKDMFSSWKNEIEEKDGHILERKKLREKEDEELYEEIKKQFYDVSADINEKAKKAFEVSAKEFKEFSEAVKDGTATVYKKLEIEKHLNQLDDFLNKIQSQGAKKFKNISDILKEKMSDYDRELNSEVEEVKDMNNKNDEDIDTLIKLAQEEYELNKK